MLSTLQTNIARAFLPFLKPARYKGAYGGRGGAKSHFFAEQLVRLAYAKPVRWVCVREVQNSIKDSVKQLLIDKIKAFGLADFFDVVSPEIRGANGSLIIFKGMQEYNAASIKSLEGFDGAWVEEAQTLSAESLRQLRPTIRNPGSEIWFSWNPRSKFDPVDEFMRGPVAPPDAISIKVTWRDNPWFPDVLRMEKDADYAKDPIMADHVWGGAYLVISEGSYYGRLMVEADQDGRIGNVPYDPALQVFTAWDLGTADPTSIWFCQQVGQEIRLIDYHEESGPGVEHYLRVLQDKKYLYGDHIFPHDVMAVGFETGRSRYQILGSLGMSPRVLPAGNVDDGINAARMMLPRCWFDAKKCERGIEALRQYHADYDDKRQTFKSTPVHDWTSHAADAFRYLARGLPDRSYDRPKRDRYSHTPQSSGGWMSA